MLWTATGRYDLEPAPGGLAFVQDLLNTISAGKPREPDLLEDVDGARTWLAQALANWSGETGRPAPVVETTAGDLQELRDFRRDLSVGPASGPEPGTQAHEREPALAGGVTASPETHRRGRTPPSMPAHRTQEASGRIRGRRTVGGGRLPHPDSVRAPGSSEGARVIPLQPELT
ncbi:ABATE domain-containing protein [Streptomyces sp. NPDC002205]|uniref:ABATE domain-containing protein n=1 Tax=Streptomyces sp. NPDC002205 TaxID=3154411 RepID=UPI003330773D